MQKTRLEELIESLKKAGAHMPIDPPPTEDPWPPMRTERINPFTTPQAKRRPGRGGPVTGKTGPQSVFKGELPPWGKLDDATWADIVPPIPFDWNLSDFEWWQWLERIIDEIDSLIWPIYRPGAWTDASVGRILDADFELLAELRPCIGLPIQSVLPTIVQHLDFFNDEDNRTIPFGTSYERYDPTLAPEILKSFSTILTAGIVDKVGSLDLQLKLVFQRPRAYQVALLQDRKNFSYQFAATANTPSLVSGHCLQGSLAACTVYFAFADWFDKNDTSKQALQRFTVDVGDRRVFAGVHYPSDNLASWYTALKLIPHVFDKSEDAKNARIFLWTAIQQGTVFKAILRHIGSNEGSPFRKIVKAIEDAAH